MIVSCPSSTFAVFMENETKQTLPEINSCSKAVPNVFPYQTNINKKISFNTFTCDNS